MALSHLFKRAGLKERDDDVLWEVDKILEQLWLACKELKAAQKSHKENNDAGLKKSLEEQEKRAWESDDPEEAKKVVAALENLIQKHRMQESYSRIKYVFKPSQGGDCNALCPKERSGWQCDD
jgi:hypothetical protein